MGDVLYPLALPEIKVGPVENTEYIIRLSPQQSHRYYKDYDPCSHISEQKDDLKKPSSKVEPLIHFRWQPMFRTRSFLDACGMINSCKNGHDKNQYRGHDQWDECNGQ